MGESKGSISGVVGGGASLQIRKTLAVFVCAYLMSLICNSPSWAEQSSKNEPNLIELARQKFGTLTPAEEILFKNASSGELADYSAKVEKDNDPSEADKWDPNRVLDSSRIEWLCMNKQIAELLTHRGIWVRGARIEGNLDLAFAKTSIPLRFEKCRFNGDINLEQANLYALDFSGTHTRSIDANRVTVEGDVRFCNNFMAEGIVNLIGAKIEGYLNCAGGKFINNTNQGSEHENKAIEATGVKVDGNVNFCDGFESKGTVSLYGATIGRELDCKGGKFYNPGWVAFNGDQMKVNGCVFLSENFEAEGQVRLIGATIGRDLDCTNGKFFITNKETIISKDFEDALKAPGLKVSGNVYMREGFEATGTVRLVSATIEGYLHCAGGKFINNTNRGSDRENKAIEATGVKVDGNVSFCDGFESKGTVSLYGATIGRELDCKRGKFTNPGWVAFNGDQMQVNGCVFLSQDFEAEGQVRLIGASIGRDLDCTNGKFFITNKETADSKGFEEALKATGLKISGNMYLTKSFEAKGMVKLVGATIDGFLDCSGGAFSNNAKTPNDPVEAIEATRLQVGGNVSMRFDGETKKKFKAEGVVSLYGAKIGGDLDCKRGEFINPEGTALCAEMLEVNQHVLLSENFHAEGEVRFESAKINGYLLLENIDSPQKTDLNLQFATIGMLNIKDIDKAMWPRKVLLHGLNYEGIDDKFADNDKTLIEWLRQQYVDPDKPDIPSGYFRPQPYEQLAKALRNSGRDKIAKKILIAKNDDKKDPNLRIPLKWYQRSWHNFLGVLIGYGYNPWRAFWIGLVIVLIGWFLFWTGSDSCAGVITPINKLAYITKEDLEKGEVSKDYPKFNAFVYSLDVFIPLVDLHQTTYWLPNVNKKEKLSIFKKVHLPIGSRFLRYFSWFQILVGWVLTLLLVASLTGLVRK